MEVGTEEEKAENLMEEEDLLIEEKEDHLIKVLSEVLCKERCIKQYAQIVVENVKFPLNQQKAERFTAETVTKIIKNFNYFSCYFMFFLLFYFC